VSILKHDHRHDLKAALAAITELMNDAQANPEGVVAEFAPYLRAGSRLTQRAEPKAAGPAIHPEAVCAQRRKQLEEAQG
jgi:hypothetical protein